MTADLDAIRARHVQTMDEDPSGGPDYCPEDGQPWPCDTAVVLAALDEERVTLIKRAQDAEDEATVKMHAERRQYGVSMKAAIEREARLRAALEGLRAEVERIYRTEGTSGARWLAVFVAFDEAQHGNA